MRSEWFFSNWFIHSDSTLPREPDWLSNDEEQQSSSQDDGTRATRRRNAKHARTWHDT